MVQLPKVCCNCADEGPDSTGMPTNLVFENSRCQWDLAWALGKTCKPPLQREQEDMVPLLLKSVYIGIPSASLQSAMPPSAGTGSVWDPASR